MQKHFQYVLIISIFHLLFFWIFNLELLLQAQAEPLHLICLQRAHKINSDLGEQIFSAIVCGENLVGGSSALHIFTVLGLIHILVVSGGHYSALKDLLSLALKKQQLLIALILFLYSLMTLFQPPGGRAFISYGLHLLNQKLRLSISTGKVEILSGLLSLAIFPKWISSISFHLSWSLSLLLCFLASPKNRNFFVIVMQNLSIQALAAIVIGSFGSLSLLANIFLAPLFAFFLFPLGLLALLIPFNFVNELWNFTVDFLMTSLSKLSEFSTTQFMPYVWPRDWLSVFTLGLIFLVLCSTPQRNHNAK